MVVDLPESTWPQITMERCSFSAMVLLGKRRTGRHEREGGGRKEERTQKHRNVSGPFATVLGQHTQRTAASSGAESARDRARDRGPPPCAHRRSSRATPHLCWTNDARGGLAPLYAAKASRTSAGGVQREVLRAAWTSSN